MNKKKRYIVEKDNDVVLSKKVENMNTSQLKKEIEKLLNKKNGKKDEEKIRKPACSTTFNF